MTKLTVKTDSNTIYISTNGSEREVKTAAFPISKVAFSINNSDENVQILTEYFSQYSIGSFANSWESVNGLKQIEKALARQRNRNRLTSMFRFGIWPALGILTGLMFTVSMNGAIKNFSYPVMAMTNSTPAYIPQNVPNTSIETLKPAASTQQPSIQKQPTQLNSSDLNSLQDAIKNGHFSVQLSSGHNRSLYVFSDPLCPHCRDIEPRLETLSRQYNVYIMPVSIIGDERSAARIAPVLDAPVEARAKLWHSTVMMPYGESDPDIKNYKGNALTIVNANDIAFAKFGFIGTPTIIADNGRVLLPSQIQDNSRLSMAIGN